MERTDDIQSKKTGNPKCVSGLYPESENQQSRPRKSPRVDCADCLDFQLDLAKSALEFYQSRVKDPENLEVVKVLGACFLNSWLRFPSLRFGSTDKCHISFSAKQKNNGSDGDSPVWFFAELMEVDRGNFRPIRCETLEILVPSVRRPRLCGVTYGCDFCPCDKKFPHPPPREGSKIFWKYPPKVASEYEASRFRHHHRPVKSLSELEAAKTALACHEMGSIYEIVEVVFLEKNFFWVEVEGTSTWYHVGFTAAAKPSITGCSDASPKCFFGELKFVEQERKFVPACCMILETSDSGLKRGCGFCPARDPYFHPCTGYRCGAWEEIPPLEFTDDSANDDCFRDDFGLPGHLSSDGCQSSAVEFSDDFEDDDGQLSGVQLTDGSENDAS